MTRSVDMAESFLKSAWNKVNEAKRGLESWHYAESISTAQECIELSMKAVPSTNRLIS